ncbi:DUF4340 domain-containing protein [Planctomycetota bacterium]|nr:DUF4340 domain-containing protein [Planctomycetota bacterium]
MNNKSTIILIAVVAALGIAYYLMTSLGEAPSSNPIPSSMQGELLFKDNGQPISGSDITKIVVEKRIIDKPIILEYKDNVWQQTSPVHFPLDTKYTQELFSVISNLRISESFKPGQAGSPSLAETELDEPIAKIAIILKSGKTYNISVGKEIKVGGLAYINIAPKDNILVTTNVFQQILTTAEPKNLWAGQVNIPSVSQLDQFTIQTSNQTPITFYNKNGDWYINPQATERANSENIDLLFAQLSPLKIQTPANEIRLSYDNIFTPTNTAAKLSFKLSDENYVFTIGPAADLNKQRYYASLESPMTSGNAIFTIPSELTDLFDVPSADWRDTRLFDINPELFRSIDITNNKGENILAVGYDPINAEFRFLPPAPPFKIDQQFANIYINSLFQAQGSAYINDASPTSEILATLIAKQYRTKKAQIVDVYSYTFDESQTIHWIDEEDQNENDLKYMALRKGESIGYLLTESQFQMLQLKPLDLRNRDILDLANDLPQKIQLTRGGRSYSFIRVNQDWALEGSSNKFERRDFNTLLAALSPLRAESWLSYSDKIRIAPINTDVTITLSYADQKQSNVIRIDTKTNQAEIQSVPPLTGRFKLPKHFLELLEKEYSNRTVLTLYPAQIKSLQINNNTITRDNRGRYYFNGQVLKDQSTAAKLINTLASLQASRYFNSLPKGEKATDTININLVDGRTYKLELFTLGKFLPENAVLYPPVPAQPISFSLPGEIAQQFTESYSKLTGNNE